MYAVMTVRLAREEFHLLPDSDVGGGQVGTYSGPALADRDRLDEATMAATRVGAGHQDHAALGSSTRPGSGRESTRHARLRRTISSNANCVRSGLDLRRRVWVGAGFVDGDGWGGGGCHWGLL